jgi:DNA-binding CsgD family transcriptional regulator
MPRELLADLARAAQWRLPARVACVAVTESQFNGRRLAPPVGPDVLMDPNCPDPFLLVPDPDAPGRQDMLARALDPPFAIGPSVPLADAVLSLRLAVQTLTLVRRGIIACDRFVRCSDQLSTLLLCGNGDMIRLMTERRYGPLAELKPQQQLRLGETLLAWLDSAGTTREIADQLHIHPQTVRYRMRQLHSLFGQKMDDPDWRFDMGIILRKQLLLNNGQTTSHLHESGIRDGQP